MVYQDSRQKARYGIHKIMRLDVDRRTAKKHKEWEHYYGKRPLCPEGKHDKDCRDADMRARESSRRTLAAALRSPYKFRKESTFNKILYSRQRTQIHNFTDGQGTLQLQ